MFRRALTPLVSQARRSFVAASKQRTYQQNKTNVRVVGSAVILSMLASFSIATCEDEAIDMPYRMLGDTGLQVSVLSFGFWATFGTKDDLKKQDAVEKAKAVLRVARKAGINLFDNAEVYGEPYGEAELVMGQAMRELREEDPAAWRRSDVLVTTKIFWGGEGVNEKGLSRKHILEGLDASLKRLQVSYVDLVYCHRPDPLSSTEQVVRAMSEAVRSGRATAWGTSEWSAQQITEAVWIARTQGLEPPQFEQPQYHCFHRERVESEYFPLYQAPYNYGITTWSPLASGLLTGKYKDGIPEGSRASAASYSWLKPVVEEWRASGKMARVEELERFARARLQCSVAQLCVAWCVKNRRVSTVLLGAANPAQLTEVLGAVAVARRLTDQDMKEIDAILGNKPKEYVGYGGSLAQRPFKTI